MVSKVVRGGGPWPGGQCFIVLYVKCSTFFFLQKVVCYCC